MSVKHGCDGCTLCCKVMKVKELNKPNHMWCEHCQIGVGCNSYETRPETCRIYECFWLKTQRLPKSMPLMLRPDKCKVVIGTVHEGEELVFYVSPERQDAWNKGALEKFVAEMRSRGTRMYVSLGDELRLV